MLVGNLVLDNPAAAAFTDTQAESRQRIVPMDVVADAPLFHPSFDLGNVVLSEPDLPGIFPSCFSGTLCRFHFVHPTVVPCFREEQGEDKETSSRVFLDPRGNFVQRVRQCLQWFASALSVCVFACPQLPYFQQTYAPCGYGNKDLRITINKP